MTRPISSRSITSSLSTGTALGRLALGLAVGAAASGYGRGAYAGTCSPIGGLGTYLCSGPADATTDVTQNFGPVSGDLTIVSLPGFGLDTSISGGDGVSASALFQDGSDDIAISTGNVTGRVNGISTNASSGLPGYVGDRYPGRSTRIDTTGGTIVGLENSGIRSFGQASDIEITTADVQGAEDGINAETYLEGSISIDTTGGAVDARTGSGIEVKGGFYSDDITIATADVSGGETGISSRTEYAANTVIDTTAGDVSARTGRGIYAYGDGFSNDITIRTANVAGATDGVYVIPAIYSLTQIDTTAGSVSGNNGSGIAVGEFGRTEGPFSTDIEITTADVFGSETGIRTDSGYLGNTTIDTTAGSVTGAGGAGIDVSVLNSDTDVSTADVTGQTDGVKIRFGVDIALDTSAGTVIGETGRGISVNSEFGYPGEINVSSADVSGFTDGIDTYGSSGSISIDTTAGAVRGATGDGIRAGIRKEGTIAIAARDVTAADAGIRVVGGAPGYIDEVSIDVQGEVVGGDVGIDAKSFSSSTTDIRIAGRVEGGSRALDLGNGIDRVDIVDSIDGLGSDVQSGIIGRSNFLGGDDLLSFIDTGGATNVLYDGVFSGLFDGGAGTDTANFSVGFDDLSQARGGGSFLDLEFSDGMGDRAFLSFFDFELFSFSDDPEVLYTANELRGLSMPPAAVPLPAGVLLLGSAIGALGFANRRARRKTFNAETKYDSDC